MFENFEPAICPGILQPQPQFMIDIGKINDPHNQKPWNYQWFLMK